MDQDRRHSFHPATRQGRAFGIEAQGCSLRSSWKASQKNHMRVVERLTLGKPPKAQHIQVSLQQLLP